MTNDEIAARIAHDLKSPLSPIRTSAYALRQGHALPAATHRELVDVIERQTQRLARMVDEARDWQRAVNATLVTRNAPQDIGMLLDLASGALDASPEIRWPAGEVPTLNGDGHRLQQMLSSLLGYCAHRDPEGVARVEVDVTDGLLRLGIGHQGSDADSAQLLDAPHYEAHDSGLGLGLLLAKAIAIAHRGTLEAHPRAGGGLRFDCVLPLPAGAAD